MIVFDFKPQICSKIHIYYAYISTRYLLSERGMPKRFQDVNYYFLKLKRLVKI